MNRMQFVALCSQSGIIDNGRFRRADAEIVFGQVAESGRGPRAAASSLLEARYGTQSAKMQTAGTLWEPPG